MKINRIVVYSLSVLFLFAIISAQEPETGYNESEVENIQQTIDEYVPIDEEGEFDPSKYKSKAEERIEKINEYVGPITKVLWGVELSLSWVFLFSFIVWILLIEFIVMPVSEVLDFNVWGSLFAAFLIATLAMQGFGQDLVAWMDSIATQWGVGLIVLGFSVILGILYSAIMKLFGKKIELWKKQRDEEKRKKDEATLHVAGKVAEKQYLKPED
jgi:hypothetical protein